jgi:hypothetical protein
MKHTLSARWRLMRRRFRRRLGLAILMAVIFGPFCTLMEVGGYIGYAFRTTGRPTPHELADVWWHCFTYGAFIFLFIILWPMRGDIYDTID